MNPLKATTNVLLIAVFMANTVQAENTPFPTESDQKIHLTADSFSGSGNNGISHYSGNVQIKQGNIMLTGDRLETLHPQGKLAKVIISGSPAEFTRQSIDNQNAVQGTANIIEYDLTTKTILFSEDAQIEQVGKHTIKGHKLTYDMSRKTIHGESTPDRKKRISVTFTPANESPDDKQPTSEQPNSGN